MENNKFSFSFFVVVTTAMELHRSHVRLCTNSIIKRNYILLIVVVVSIILCNWFAFTRIHRSNWRKEKKNSNNNNNRLSRVSSFKFQIG